MQKKKARKGFLFLRRESVLRPCRAGPVCPAGTNAVFCGGTHGSRPTDRCGKPSVGDGVPTSRQRGSAALHLGGQSRPPLRTLSLRASPRREASALGVQTGAAIRFPTKERTDSHASDTVTGVGMTALPRCKAPSVRGLSAQPTGGEKKRVTDLPPPALRAATSLAEGGFGRPPP